MIGGVLQNDKQGRVGDIKTVKHFMALERYLVSPDENGNTDERLLRLRNTYSLNSQVNPSDKESINEYVLSVRDGYKNFMEEIGREKKPPKTKAKHSVISFRPDEIERLESKIKKKYPNVNEENLQNKVLDFVEQMAMQYLDNHMTNNKKNIKGLNRQYTIAIHGEKDHLHAHIVCNTVCYNNKVYSKTREDLHNQEWCQRMAAKYDFLIQNLNFKKVNDYVLDETQKQKLESEVKLDRKDKRVEFVNDCEEANLNHKQVLNVIKAAMNTFKENKLIKPEHVIKSFENENLKNIFQLQPVFHIKKRKVTGMSFKVHTKKKTLSIKSSLLPVEYQFKSLKQNIQDYSIDNTAYDKLNDWFGYIADCTYESRAVISSSDIGFKTWDDVRTRYKSRYFELNNNGDGLKFKTGWGNLKNKTVISLKSEDRMEINVLNPAVIKEAIRLAKEKGWGTVLVKTQNDKTAQLYIKEAEAQGIKIRFDNNEIAEKVKQSKSLVLKKKEKTEPKQEVRESHEVDNKRMKTSRYAPKLKPTFNSPSKKKKKDDEEN
jgi:hypothetical protein